MTKHKAITKLEALKWTWILWRDVAESYVNEDGEVSGDDAITKYLAAKAYNKEFYAGCPCCEYMVDNYPVADDVADWCMAGKCILNKVWGSDMSFACEEAGSSPYKMYSSTWNSAANHEAARKIADGAWELYLKECEAQGVKPENKFLMPTINKS